MSAYGIPPPSLVDPGENRNGFRIWKPFSVSDSVAGLYFCLKDFSIPDHLSASPCEPHYAPPLGKLLAQRGNADVGFALALLAELYGSVYECEEGVILAHADVFTGVVDRAALTDDDVARLCELAAEQFDAESLAFRLTAVLRTTYTFLVCHVDSVFKGYATISSTRICVRYWRWPLHF